MKATGSLLTKEEVNVLRRAATRLNEATTSETIPGSLSQDIKDHALVVGVDQIIAKLEKEARK